MVGSHLDQTVTVGLPGDVRSLLLRRAHAFHIFISTGAQTCSTVVMRILKYFLQGPVTSIVITVLTASLPFDCSLLHFLTPDDDRLLHRLVLLLCLPGLHQNDGYSSNTKVKSGSRR